MNDSALVVFLVGLVAATLRVATPLVLAAIGEVFTERGGVLNLGIEGIMFLGAFVGFAVAYHAEAAGLGGYLWLGLLAAVAAGLVMALLMGLLVVTLGLNQHVSGLGITLLCGGLSLFGFRLVFGESSVLPSVDPFAQLSPFGDLPILGPVFSQYLLTYLAFLVVTPLGGWVLYRTHFGLNLRAVGENPEAADSLGVSVKKLQRLLALENTSFSDILDEVRHTIAVRLLSESDAPISRVAGLLDYSTVPPFTLAFRRWTGVSPRAFRSARLSSPPETSACPSDS